MHRRRAGGGAGRGGDLELEVFLDAKVLEQGQGHRSKHVHLHTHTPTPPLDHVRVWWPRRWPLAGGWRWLAGGAGGERTDMSLSSLVIPVRVMLKGFLAKGARHTSPSRKYPIDLRPFTRHHATTHTRRWHDDTEVAW